MLAMESVHIILLFWTHQFRIGFPPVLHVSRLQVSPRAPIDL